MTSQFSNPAGAHVVFGPDPTKSLLPEIILALNERSGVSGIGSPITVAKGQEIQSAEFWNSLQSLAEALPYRFLKTGSHDGPRGWEGFTGPFVNYTDISTIREVAGMHPSGFRRVPRGVAWDAAVDDWTDLDNPKFRYGPMQAGDICIAPWIIDDLQRLLGLCQQSAHGNGYPSFIERRVYVHLWDVSVSCAEAYVAAEAIWSDAVWTPGGQYSPATISPYYSVVATIESLWPGDEEYGYEKDQHYGYRTRSIPFLAGIPTRVQCACDIYFMPHGTHADGAHIFGPMERFHCHQTLPPVNPPRDTRGGPDEALGLGFYDDFPASALGVDCDHPGTGFFYVDRETWVLRWLFSHVRAPNP